jgi:hypothetical protein
VAGAVVRVQRGAAQWQAQADGMGAFQLPGVPLIAGENAFSVRAEDGFGNQSATLVIRVQATGVVLPVPAWNWYIGTLLVLLIMVLAGARMRAQERKS